MKDKIHRTLQQTNKQTNLICQRLQARQNSALYRRHSVLLGLNRHTSILIRYWTHSIQAVGQFLFQAY
jgi:hypothetical protein